MKNRGRKTYQPVCNRRPSPLRFDPTRTGGLRKHFAAKLRAQFARLKLEMIKLILQGDVLGLKQQVVGNADSWRFRTDPDKLAAFKEWLKKQLRSMILGKSEEELWEIYTKAGYLHGASRSYDDVAGVVVKSRAPKAATARTGFLQGVLGAPVSVDKVKLLASRTFDELENVTTDMSNRMSRVLVDGLVKGQSPRQIARTLSKTVDLGRERALLIARTEIIRAHAEGQLDAMESLGVEEVGAAVEWSTAGDDKVCDLCAPLQGVVLKTVEARGMLPRHPNCRCAWIPAGVGESSDGQKTSKGSIVEAIRVSMKRGGVDELDETQWGPGSPIAKSRPTGNALEEFSQSLLILRGQ